MSFPAERIMSWIAGSSVSRMVAPCSGTVHPMNQRGEPESPAVRHRRHGASGHRVTNEDDIIEPSLVDVTHQRLRTAGDVDGVQVRRMLPPARKVDRDRRSVDVR